MKFLAFAALLAPFAASAATWDLDPSHSSAEFKVKHLMVSTVKGHMKIKSATITTDDKDITKSTVEAVIDATTVDTGDAKRDGHLKSPDFFEVDKNPTLTFKSAKIEKGGKGLKITGGLTMHGVTKDATLDCSQAPEVKTPWGDTRTAFSCSTTVMREEWGLKWNKALEAGGFMVGKDVGIEIEVELVKKDPGAVKKS
jgi:polyisoprenoid-binding protein YceI